MEHDHRTGLEMNVTENNESALESMNDVAMDQLLEHDEHSVGSHQQLFSGSDYEGGASVQGEDSKYDNLALTDLISKLRGDGASSADFPGASSSIDADIVTEEEKDEQLTDDVIALHLKALSHKGRKQRVAVFADEDLSDTEEMSITDNSDDDDDDDDGDESLMSCNTSYPMDSLDADNTNYDGLDEIMKMLGVDIDSEANTNESGRESWLTSSMIENNAAFDFDEAPPTFASRKMWLANLAKLILEDDSDDESVSTNLSVMDHRYQQNRNGLTNHAKVAEILMHDRAKAPPGLDETAILTDTETPKQQWEVPQTIWKRKSAAAALLAKQAQALAQKQSVVDTTASEAQSSEIKSPLSALPTRVSNETSSSSPGVDNIPPRKRSIYASTPTVPKAMTMARMLREKALALNNIKINVVMPSFRETTKAPVGDEPVSTDYTQKEQSFDEPLHGKDTMLVMKTKRSESVLLRTELVKIATVERSQQPATPDSEKRNDNTLPSGLPPYPGYGPRWLWHPDSPRAPKGYRECYMEHMGDCYREYMCYLKARAANGGSGETKVEKIMRASLSSQASFKKALRASSTKKAPFTSGLIAKKNQPAISPDNFASKPGRARVNCAVPVALPRIDEGSVSSSGSSGLEKSVHAPPSETYKKVIQKKTRPDVVKVGKVHQKSKGKVGMIVIASGKELDKQAKEKKMQAKKQKGEINSGCRSKAVPPKTAFPEQPDQGCACTIM